MECGKWLKNTDSSAKCLEEICGGHYPTDLCPISSYFIDVAELEIGWNLIPEIWGNEVRKLVRKISSKIDRLLTICISSKEYLNLCQYWQWYTSLERPRQSLWNRMKLDLLYCPTALSDTGSAKIDRKFCLKGLVKTNNHVCLRNWVFQRKLSLLSVGPKRYKAHKTERLYNNY